MSDEHDWESSAWTEQNYRDTIRARDATIKTQGEEIDRLRGDLSSCLRIADRCAMVRHEINHAEAVELNRIRSALAPGVKSAREVKQ